MNPEPVSEREPSVVCPECEATYAAITCVGTYGQHGRHPERLCRFPSGSADLDYSPAYQDEYQRLWRRDAAENQALKEENKVLRRRLGEMDE